MPFHKFYGIEADEVARKLLPLSAEQTRLSLNSSTTKVSTARLKRRLKLFLNNFMRRYLTGGTCVVNLFAKGVLVTGSFHAKLIAARLYASKSIVMLNLQPILEPSSSGTVVVLWYF